MDIKYQHNVIVIEISSELFLILKNVVSLLLAADTLVLSIFLSFLLHKPHKVNIYKWICCWLIIPIILSHKCNFYCKWLKIIIFFLNHLRINAKRQCKGVFDKDMFTFKRIFFIQFELKWWEVSYTIILSSTDSGTHCVKDFPEIASKMLLHFKSVFPIEFLNFMSDLQFGDEKCWKQKEVLKKPLSSSKHKQNLNPLKRSTTVD